MTSLSTLVQPAAAEVVVVFEAGQVGYLVHFLPDDRHMGMYRSSLVQNGPSLGNLRFQQLSRGS